MTDARYHPIDPENPNLPTPDLCGSGEPRDIDPKEKQFRDMLQRYKKVFGTDEGRRVLGDILTSCHFGETLDPDNRVQVSEFNVGLTILYKTGFLEVICLQLGMGK
jgi:hypothetical protein